METLLTLLMGMMVLGGCLMFVLVVSPALLWIGVVAVGIFVMAGIHYLLWGRWLGRIGVRLEETPAVELAEEPWDGHEFDAYSDEPPAPVPPDEYSE